MTMNDGRYLMRLRNMLIDGPRSVFPAEENLSQYLESMVSVVSRSYAGGHWSSFHIFCDANGDDEAGHLTPMVRFAEWHKTPDDPAFNRFPWPNVRIELAQLPLDDLDMHSSVRELLKALALVPFPIRDLPVRRDFGEGPEFGPGTLTVYAYSGYQSMERQIYVVEVPELVAIATRLEQTLRRLAIPVLRSEWRERYDNGPTELMDNGRSWFWDGEPVG